MHMKTVARTRRFEFPKPVLERPVCVYPNILLTKCIGYPRTNFPWGKLPSAQVHTGFSLTLFMANVSVSFTLGVGLYLNFV